MKYVLCKGEVLTLESDGAIEAISVADGRIWLTRSGDTRDYCLEAGGRLPVATACMLIIEALQPATLILCCRQSGTALNVTMAWQRWNGMPGTG